MKYDKVNKDIYYISFVFYGSMIAQVIKKHKYMHKLW